MNSIQYLLDALIGIYALILFFRAWFQFCGVDFYNPLSQFLVKATQPLLAPLRKVLPTVKKIDTAALAALFILLLIKYPLLNFIGTPLLTGEPLAYVLLALLGTLSVIGKSIMYVLFIGAIASWFNRGNGNAMQYLLYQLGEPILRPIRRFLPNTGMIDFSPMIVMFALFFLNRLMFDLFGGLWSIA